MHHILLVNFRLFSVFFGSDEETQKEEDTVENTVEGVPVLVVKNPPANIEDLGPIPDPGRSHMMRSN